MRTMFYDDELPEDLGRSVFLAGPTARGAVRTPWRQEALLLLEELAFDGTVLLPEFRDRRFPEAVGERFGTPPSEIPTMRSESFNVLKWETEGIERSTVVLFWMPFRTAWHRSFSRMVFVGTDGHMPGLTTRAEVSRELARDPSRIVMGMPPDAETAGHIRYHAAAAGKRVFDSLQETVEATVRAVL